MTSDLGSEKRIKDFIVINSRNSDAIISDCNYNPAFFTGSLYPDFLFKLV